MSWNETPPELIELALQPQLRLLSLVLGCALCGLLTGRVTAALRNVAERRSWRGRFLAFWAGGEDRMETLGRSLLKRMSERRTRRWTGAFDRQRMWLELQGETASLPRLLGIAAAAAGTSAAMSLLWQAPLLLVAGAAGAAYPFIRLRSRARSIRKRTERALPELLTLIAAEMAAGLPAEGALRNAAGFGGPLSSMIGLAELESRQLRIPLFGRAESPGAWRRVTERYGLPSLRAFAVQIEIAARKGAAGPELMVSLSRSLILSYKEQALREVEKFEHRLAVPSVLFFFLPLMAIVLTPLLLPLMDALQ